MSKKNLLFPMMHLAFLLYALYAVIGKIATQTEFLSARFLLLYGTVFVVLFVYALLWQQVIKVIPLTTAIANKSITIVWGMIFGLLFFGEQISLKMLIGAALILAGIFILSTEQENQEKEHKETAE